MLEMLFWNIATVLVLAVIILVNWVIRIFFTPNILKKLDIEMIEQKDKAISVIEDLKKTYRIIRKYIVLFSFIYLIIIILHILKVIKVFTDCPLPFIWIGIILSSAYFAYSFCIKNLDDLRKRS